MRRAMLAWSLLLLGPIGLSAQRPDEPLFTPEDTLDADPQPESPNDGGMVLAGLGGMIVGALGVGSSVSRSMVAMD
jgi:hypothetical protein